MNNISMTILLENDDWNLTVFCELPEELFEEEWVQLCGTDIDFAYDDIKVESYYYE